MLKAKIFVIFYGRMNLLNIACLGFFYIKLPLRANQLCNGRIYLTIVDDLMNDLMRQGIFYIISNSSIYIILLVLVDICSLKDDNTTILYL